MREARTKRQGRINMRVDERQERVLRAAADLSGETLTSFVLAGATARAEEVLQRAHRIELDAKAFDAFVTALDGPDEEMPKLSEYSRRRSPMTTS